MSWSRLVPVWVPPLVQVSEQPGEGRMEPQSAVDLGRVELPEQHRT